MERLRLAEVLGALSLATDLSTASPVEFGIRATTIATRLARDAGVPHEELPTAYYACLTRMLGCTATAMDTASMAMGHDRLFNYAVLTCDWSDPGQVEPRLREVLSEVIPADSLEDTIREILHQFDGIAEGAGLHCVQAMMLTTRLPLPPGVPDLLEFIWSRWDGKFPGAAGAEIPLSARVISLARAVDLARCAGGRAGAEAVARERRGTELDPDLCDLFLSNADRVLDGLDAATAWDTFLDAEPGSVLSAGPDEIATIAEAFADFTDQKSGWFSGHSRRVSSLAAAAGAAVGLDDEQRRAVALAGLLHDVGRVGVHNGIWDKPGELTPRERQLAEAHSHHTETVLRMSSAFAVLARAAATAHERGDGSGYHRGQRVSDPMSGLLASADVYDALVNDRPWRSAFAPDDAAREIQTMCRNGQLHADCAAAVLSVARGGEAIGVVYPAGLTPREVQVIKLLITGLPTKTIASRLSISPKTADKHIQSAYEKTGARGRAPIALFALEHGMTATW